MREIIFRGKSTDEEEWIEGWIEGLLCYNIYDGLCIQPATEGFCCVVSKETIGQFTGSYDVNGNKIFEHDIVKKVVNGKEFIGVVEYADAAFGVRFADGEGQFLCFLENCCEIIGNIHDNPELTKM